MSRYPLRDTMKMFFYLAEYYIFRMCHDVRVVEIDGVKYAQYIDYFGEIELQVPILQEEKPEVIEEPRPILVKNTRRRIV